MNNKGASVSKQIDQHSVGKSVFLHLVPGIIVTFIYIALIPMVKIWGYPSMLALFIAVSLGVIPFQLGYVFYHAKRVNGNYSFKGIFPYSKKSPWWHYVIVTIFYIAWSVLCFLILPKYYSHYLMENFFFWVPEWFIPNKGSILTSTAAWVIIITGFFSNISGAVIEELYFRGILLPKVSWMGKWAPLFTTFLFTVYHFDSIWQSIERYLSMLPLVFLVWWKKDLRMILIPHCALNAVSIALMAIDLTSK